ncbi:MAG: glycosyltransferase family 2 protein [Candidatus Obscuribacterales bacterium]|nr:glycosyltransferase family 2 protein [Candidatus Obscuribacterales bacterium]
MITVVIPAFNEEHAIEGTILSLRNVLESSGISAAEILVIDDGSMDATGIKSRSAGARVLRHPQNVGYGRSLKSGICAARFDTILIIDADLTYPAESIPALLNEYHKGFDMVVGARTGHHYSGSMYKGPLRLVLQALVEFTAGRKVPDANSGMRIFSKSTIIGYLDHLCDTFSFTTSLTLAYMLTGRFVSYLSIPYHARVGKTKVKLLKDSLRTLQYIAQSAIYYNPMKIFILFSLLCIVLSIGGFAFTAITNISAPYFLGIGGLLLSLLMFGLGLMADLMRQILVSSRRSAPPGSVGTYSNQYDDSRLEILDAGQITFAPESKEHNKAPSDNAEFAARNYAASDLLNR